jgi:hypothetical protein
MISPDRLKFIEEARTYLSDIMKYSIEPDYSGMGDLVILYNLYKLEDWCKLTYREEDIVQETIKCLEKMFCGTTPNNVSIVKPLEHDQKHINNHCKRCRK